MTRRLARLLLVIVALAAAAAAASGPARAAGPVFTGFCTSVAPDAALTFGAGTTSVSAGSGGTGYTSGRCPRFVVDITVPPNSSGPAGYANEFLLGSGHGSQTGPIWWLPFTELSTCLDYTRYVAVYRRSTISGDFTFVGGGRMTGQSGAFYTTWICKLVADDDFVAFDEFSPPPFFTAAVYRVFVGATLGGIAQPVSVWAWRMPW
jgi:hypothetical protein